MVTICTTSLTFNNSTFCPHSVFMCFVWISEQTAIISLYSINWLVFITDTNCLMRTDQFTTHTLSSLTNLDQNPPHLSPMHKTPHTPNNNLTSNIFYSLLLYYSTVNFNQTTTHFFKKSEVIQTPFICILFLTTLKMAICGVETCRLPLWNKIVSMKTKCICYYFNTFYGRGCVYCAVRNGPVNVIHIQTEHTHRHTHTYTHQMLCCRITTLTFYIFNKF